MAKATISELNSEKKSHEATTQDKKKVEREHELYKQASTREI